MKNWTIQLQISRQKGDEKRSFQEFQMEVSPDEYVLDAVERVWAIHDRSLVYRHACHHSTCGACGMLVNGVEKLTCITPIRSVVNDGGVLRVEPLRNFPVVADLSVDMASMYANLETVGATQVASLEDSKLPFETSEKTGAGNYERLADCLECGMCISACPVALTTPAYMGPAVLAGAHAAFTADANPCHLSVVDSADGLWRCHSGYECSAVCPSNVDPAWRIMDLRKKTIAQRFRRFFGGGQEKTA